MSKNNYIADFSPEELDLFRRLCNFTDSELQYFELKVNDKSNVQIAMQMHVSEPQVSKIAKRVKSKIIRVL